MKKVLSLLLVVIALLSFASCLPKNKVDEKGKITVVIMEESSLVYEVKLDDLDMKEGALSVVKYLNTEKGVALEYQDSTYGAYLTKLGNISTDKAGYLSVFTSVESDWDVSSYCVTKEYEGVTVKTSGIGVSGMSVVDGMILYFCYIAY